MALTINGRAVRVVEVREQVIVVQPLNGGPLETISIPPAVPPAAA